MARIRQIVSVVAFVWLLAHATTFAVSMAGLCCEMPEATTASDDADECCKGLAPGQMCPLHKHGSHHASRMSSTQTAPAAGECRLRSGCHPPEGLLTGLTLALGMLVDVQTVGDAGTAPSIGASEPLTHQGLASPTSPPPKA